jgi:predicted phage tail protein
MVASKAVYEAVIGKARQAANEIQPTADWVCRVLEDTFCSDLRYLVDPVIGLPGTNLCPMVKLAIQEFQRILAEYLPKLYEALNSLELVPPFMYDAAAQWKDIQKLADEVSDSTLALSQSQEMGWWEGDAGKAYSQGVGDQSGAAGAIGGTAGSISGACSAFFEAAFGAALGIGVGLVTFLGSVVAAPADGGSTLPLAALGLGIAVTSALVGMAYETLGPEQQLQGLVPIPGMPGGKMSTGGGWPSATQGSL